MNAKNQKESVLDLAMTGALAMTILVGILAFLLVRSQENQMLRAQFHLDAEDCANAIERELDRNVGMVQSLAAFYASSVLVERHEFHRYLHELEKRYEAIQAFLWAPRVPQAAEATAALPDRAEFEAMARQQGFPGFQITELSPDGAFVRAGRRSEYFPVYFMEPFGTNAAAHGYDLASDPVRRDAVRAARASGGLVASGLVSLLDGKPGFMVLYAVRDPKLDGAGGELGADNLVGICAAEFRLPAIVRSALESVRVRGLTLTILDPAAPESGQGLKVRSGTDTGAPSAARGDMTEDVPPEWRHQVLLDVAGHAWTVVVAATRAYRSNFPRWQSWSTLAGGIVLTGFIGFSFYREYRRAEDLEKHVAERTRELAEASDHLRMEIAERARTEEELTRNQRQLQAILDNTTAVIFVKDLEGRYCLVNRQFELLFQVHNGRILGKTDFEVFPEDIAGQLRANDRKVLEIGQPLEMEETVPQEDGRHTYISIKVPMQGAEGKMIALCGISTDITERKKDERQLRQTNAELEDRERRLRVALRDLEDALHKLQSTQLQLIQAEKLESIGKLAAGVAHEVKNPLQTMMMGISYLERLLSKGDANVKLACADMREAIERADAIVRGLLQMSGSPDLELTEEDLNEIADKALWLVNYHLNASRVIAERHFSPDLPRLWLDRGKMEQVFINLFTNAIHAMPQGGTLTIATRLEADQGAETRAGSRGNGDSAGMVVAEVRDTGTGIAREHRDKLFTPFFTTKQKGVGTGLGLSVTRTIVELHGGRIALENVPEGGTRATMIFQSNRPQEILS